MNIPVFYNPKQIHRPNSVSRSPSKPAISAGLLVEDSAFELHSNFNRAKITDLAYAHTAKYLYDVCEFNICDGFGEKSNEAVDAIFWTNGNFLAAVDYALEGKHPGVVWSLTSGFHHAHADSGGGFCTFNALAVAAIKAYESFRGRTLVIDEDAHLGDGFVSIMKDQEAPCAYMYSDYTHKSGMLSLKDFEAHVDRIISGFEPDLILYQAGADNWKKDSLGAGKLSKKQLRKRDDIVFSAAREFGVPIVANLAGGYALDFNDTIDIHMATGESMKSIYLKPEEEGSSGTTTFLGRGRKDIQAHRNTERNGRRAGSA